MGNLQEKELSMADAMEIQKVTHFSTEEIQMFYQAFVKDYPQGGIDEDQFVARYSELCPYGDAKVMAKEVFRCSDLDGNGVINFKEFMEMVSVLSRGSIPERLSWAFGLFDKDNDGEIARPELLEMLKAMHRVHGKEDNEKVALEADKIFHVCDKNGDSRISREEFMWSQTFL